jgi:hypothetical protein
MVVPKTSKYAVLEEKRLQLWVRLGISQWEIILFIQEDPVSSQGPYKMEGSESESEKAM